MPPRRLPLEYELLHSQLGRILLLHDTDRWYLGDFLRHSSWVTCLDAAGPRELVLATNPGYLPLFSSDNRVGTLLDVGKPAHTAGLAGYDLVVVPSTLRPAAFRADVARGLYSWNDGWAYTRHGAPVAGGRKTDLNYFTAALHRHGQTALPTATPVGLNLGVREPYRAARAVRHLFGDERPVIVYNPTASNPATRQTSLAKEVENVLTTAEHVALLSGLRQRLPGHNVLIGSALVVGDEDNRRQITALRDAVAADPAIRSIFDLPGDESTSLRGFAVLLASDAVAASVGTSTGTNTHLAALVGLPSFSVERGADAAMIANWNQPGQLPMGSFRWRNPSPLVGAYNLDWHRKILADFAAVAAAAAAHLTAFTTAHTPVIHTLLGRSHDLPGAPGPDPAGDLETSPDAEAGAGLSTGDAAGDAPGDAARDTAGDAAGDAVRQRAGLVLALLASGRTSSLLHAADSFARTLPPPVRDWLSDFTDELTYLRRRPGFDAVTSLLDLLRLPEEVLLSEGHLIAELLRDSMLHKTAQLAAADLTAPVSSRRHHSTPHRPPLPRSRPGRQHPLRAACR